MLKLKMNSAISLPLNLCHYRNLSSKNRRRLRRSVPAIFSVIGSPRPVSEIAEDDVLRTFIRERELNGDLIAKVSDRIWLRDAINSYDNGVIDEFAENNVQSPEEEASVEDTENGGFLKLKRTSEWVLGDSGSAPVNKKMTIKEFQNDSERKRKLNLLRYEALKRDLLLLTVGIGSACSGYCLVVLSVEAALSYGIGVVFSCLYLQLLWQYVDNLSKEAVPRVFLKKKSKKIGIRSEDLQDLFERSVKGSGLALSSPRLVIPPAIYALWELSQHFTHNLFDFQLLPAMVGIFAYKAAALVQLYRDNEDLRFIFPDDEETSSS